MEKNTKRDTTLAKRIKREPVMKAALFTPLIVAILQVLRAFGVGLTDEQNEAVVALATIIIPILLSLWARSLVTPINDPRNNEGEMLVTVTEAEIIIEESE